ncbi:MAG TPA: hypothetical protein VHF92_00365 [Geodermatophilus sp.]|nr:hypothetical protein [Geodermatophilus sp.]
MFHDDPPENHVPQVTVADNVLAQGEPFFEDGEVTGWSSSPAFLITGDDVERTAAAVYSAGQRIFMLNEHGREIDESEMNVGYYTPSWVSDVYVTDAGVVLFVDTNGDLTRKIGEAMIDIFVHELTARGVSAHIAALPRGFQPGDQVWAP